MSTPLTSAAMADAIVVQSVTFDHPDAVRLCAAQQLEIQNVKPANAGIVASAANIPIFLVAYANDAAVACGGLRPLEQSRAEIKRM